MKLTMKYHVPGVALFMLLILTANSLFSQIKVGEWRTHLPYNYANLVMVSGDKAYCSTTGGLFYYGLDDNSLYTLSKTEGLSDNGVVAMAWNEETDIGLLAYENSNIDIIKNNKFINVPDIMKKPIPGDKTVNSIFFHNMKAYLSCGFGIVVIDLDKIEISETIYIGDNGERLAVNQITSDGTMIYAATDEGIRYAELSNPFLIDFNSWELMTGLPEQEAIYSGIVYYNNHLFASYKDPSGIKDVLYMYEDTWNEFSAITDSEIREIKSAENDLLVTGNEGIKILNQDLLIIKEIELGSARSVVIDDQDIVWIADFGRGLIRAEGEEQRSIKPNGPYSTIAYDMEDAGGILYAVSGGISTTYNNLFRTGTLHSFHDERWRSYISYEYRDLLSLAVDPQDPEHVFAGSWGYGLMEYQAGQLVELYNEFNSSLQNYIPGSNVIRIGGIAFDNESNLWMTNTGVSEPLSVRKNDGTWKSFKAEGKLTSYPALGEIVVTKDNHIWGIIPKGHGLFAYNYNETIDDESDDQFELVSVVDEYGKVITNEIFALTEDQNGNLWLGTNQGILVIYSPSYLFEDEFIYARDICIPRSDTTNKCDPLLSTQKVTCIEVDGGNRKWIGTASGGAFLVSSNGYEQVHSFNTSNSPLLSNNIADICVDGQSGEVFFGTEKGIVSFRGTSTEGADSYENVKVFPNPVREDYFGPIAITGLMNETTVKITDVGGNLVNEIESFGGEAIWDGTNLNGERVATGVYLIFLANRDVTDGHVTKILFIH